MSRESKKRRRREEAEREQLLSPDAFEAQGATWASWFEKNLKFVVIGLVLVLVSVVGLEVARTRGLSSSAEHTQRLIEVVRDYQNAVSLQAVVTSTSAEADAKRYREAQAGLQELLKGEEPPDGLLGLVHLYHGDLARKANDLEAALASYDRFLDSAEPQDRLRFFALEGKGYALEAADRPEDALAVFRKLEAMEGYGDYGLKHVARVLEEQGDVEGARTALEKIVTRQPESPLKEFAEQKLALLD